MAYEGRAPYGKNFSYGGAIWEILDLLHSPVKPTFPCCVSDSPQRTHAYGLRMGPVPVVFHDWRPEDLGR